MTEQIKVIHIVLNSFTFDSRVQKEVNSLKKAGYQIFVFALQEKNFLEEEPGNPYIRRFKLKTRPWPKKKFFQAFKYLELIYLAMKEAKKIKPQIVHAHDLNALPIGYLISLRHRTPLIYDAHEFETERDKFKSELLKKILRIIEGLLIRRVSKTITVSQSIALAYQKMYKIKPELILNCSNYQKSLPKNKDFRKKNHLPLNKKIFIYQGSLDPGRGVEILIQVFKELKNENIALLLMGYGALKEEVQKAALDSPETIFFRNAVPPNELVNYTCSTDFGLSVIENISLNRYCALPNKLFQYFMAGLPAIVSNIPEQKRIVEKFNCGLVVNPKSKEEIKAAILKLANSDTTFYRQQALKAAKVYNWENEEKKLLKIYENVLREVKS